MPGNTISHRTPSLPLFVPAVGLFALLALGNVAAWAWAVIEFWDRPVMLGTALLAYTFGLRHAVDADHIAAIDNVTRKLMQQGKRPFAVGLFFSLGHSAVVILMSAAVAFATSEVTSRFESLKDIGSIISTCASAAFLFLLALMNFVVLIFGVAYVSGSQARRTLRRGGSRSPPQQSRLSRPDFRPVFRLVTKSWHLFFVGFLFGLGFDTATEVALFGISSRRPPMDCRSARSSCFPSSSPPACRLSIRSTAS